MKANIQLLVISVTTFALISLKALGCSNHPPQKTSGNSSSTASGYSASAATSGSAGETKILKSVKTDSGQKAWSEGFFQGAPRNSESTVVNAPATTDVWTSAIP